MESKILSQKQISYILRLLNTGGKSVYFNIFNGMHSYGDEVTLGNMDILFLENAFSVFLIGKQK